MQRLQAAPAVDHERIAAIGDCVGYCFGGGVVLRVARIGTGLDAVVSFHGTLAPITPAEQRAVKADVVVCHGGADPFVAREQLTAFKA